ncbi:MAG: tRNA (5-methylaminomethyl-2-thiouridine)(34)-methyltransferase MnmD [Niabella sp.]
MEHLFADPRVIVTEDGSHSIIFPQSGITFHSTHGAVQESQKVFIEYGLEYLLAQKPDGTLRIFEMGFGTGLNALLAAIKARDVKVPIHYTAIDLYPLSEMFAAQINYGEKLREETLYRQLIAARWDNVTELHPFFTIEKQKTSLLDYHFSQSYNLIFFDAFAPNDQPELWKVDIFNKLFNALKNGGVLTTYCSKSMVRKALMEAGFLVEKLPGPPGKREVLRAIKGY